MAQTTEYFQTAAAQLHRAAQEKRAEVSGLRRQIDQKYRDLVRRNENLRHQIREKEAQIARPQPENESEKVDKTQVAVEAQNLQQEIFNNEQEFNREREATQRQISDQEKDIIDIEQQANDLQKKS